MDSRCYHQFTGDMDIAQMTLDVMETSNAWPQGATAQAWLRKETVSKCQRLGHQVRAVGMRIGRTNWGLDWLEEGERGVLLISVVHS